MPRVYQLTYDRSLLYWKKVIRGRTYYFHRAKCKSDRAAYLIALQKYQEQLPRILGQAGTVPGDESDSSDSAGIKRLNKRQLGRVVAIYLADLKRRTSLTKTQGGITLGRLKNVTTAIRCLVRHFGEETVVSNIKERDLQGYLDALKASCDSEEIAGHTMHQRIVIAKNWLKWAYRNRHLRELPRNIDDLKVPKPRTEIHFFEWREGDTPDVGREIQRLLREFKDRDDLLATCVYLGLNCGFGMTDIADLRARDFLWKSRTWRRIERSRSKSHVWGSHLLWQRTEDLLRKNMVAKDSEYNSDALLLRLPSGKPLQPSGYSNGSPMAKRFRKIVRQVFGEGDLRTFYCLRKTGATYCAHRWAGTETLYLAHQPSSMAAKHYAKVSYSRLDMVLCWMESDFGVGDFVRRYPLEDRPPRFTGEVGMVKGKGQASAPQSWDGAADSPD